MTESGSRSTNRQTDSESSTPRAVLHKKILDTAQERPDASMKELADDISGATTSIVKRVLQQYGDPGIEAESDEEEEQEGTSEEATATETADTTDSSERNDSTATVSKDKSADSSPDSRSDDGHDDSEAATDGTIFQVDGPDYESDSSDESADDRHAQHVSIPDISELTEKQLETMQAIRERPTATQAELADELGVTSATINQRVNSISGFDWSNRHVFVEKLFYRAGLSNEYETETSVDSRTETSNSTETSTVSSENTASMMDHDTSRSNTDDELANQQYEDLSSQVDKLSEQLEALEQRVETQSSSASFSDPALAHKVIHACVTSDQISEEEELRIIENIIE